MEDAQVPPLSDPFISWAVERVKECVALEARHGHELTEDEIEGVCVAALVRESGHVCAVCGADPTAPDAQPEAWGISSSQAEGVHAILCPLHRRDEDD